MNEILLEARSRMKNVKFMKSGKKQFRPVRCVCLSVLLLGITVSLRAAAAPDMSSAGTAPLMVVVDPAKN